MEIFWSIKIVSSFSSLEKLLKLYLLFQNMVYYVRKKINCCLIFTSGYYTTCTGFFSLAYQYIRKWTYFHLTKKNGPYSIFLKKIFIHIRNACYFFYSTNATYCSSFKYFINAYSIFKEQKLRFWYIKVSRIKAFALKCYIKYFPNSLKMNNLAFYTRILISSYL